MIDKVKQFILKLNTYGIPIPLIHDPNTKAPSVSLTMLFISFNVVFFGLIGKLSKVLDIDLTQALYWNGMCIALYFGRKFSNGTTSISDGAQNNESSK